MHPGGGGGQGPVPEHFDDFRSPGIRGGWGPFIGLRGGRPMDNKPNNGVNPAQGGPPVITMPMAVVTTAPLIANQIAQQQQQQQITVVSTAMSAVTTPGVGPNGVGGLTSGVGGLTSGGFTQVRPLQVTSTAIRSQGQPPQAVMASVQRPQGGPRLPTGVVQVRAPNLQQMPPSSAHQVTIF